MHFVIICDFDGTITKTDTGQSLLNELANEGWKKYDDMVIDGDIGTREALVAQYSLVKTTKKQYNTIVQSIDIDSTFNDFYKWIKEKDIPFYILSDGFESYIKQILKKYSIDPNGIPIIANEMEIKGEKIKLIFNTEDCEHGCANCKLSHVNKLKTKYEKIIYIGDGLSDILPAKEGADLIFARKGRDLSKVLEGDNRLIVFDNFNEIKTKIVSTLEE